MASILMVDDNQGFRRTMCRALRRAGFEVDEASDGHQAGRMLESTAYDLVVTDVFMPDMDGYEFLRSVRERKPDLPVIAVTGGFGNYSGTLAGRLMEQLGAMSSLTKPVTADNLVEEVKRVLA